jgi:hypothetical protein
MLRCITLPESHGSTNSDESELVRVGPSCESERGGVVLDRLYNGGDLLITYLQIS